MYSEVRRPFACTFDDCGYRAATRGTLKFHVQAKHTPEVFKEFQCPLCPSKFASKSRLCAHISHHLKEKTYKCVSCNFATRSSGSLSRHIQAVHASSVAFKCAHSGCQYRTNNPRNWNRHLQIHDTDPIRKRPVPCNFADCTFRAYNPAHLKQHVEYRHNPTRKKEHDCALCSKAFYTIQALRIHIRSVHTREKTFCFYKCSFKTHHSGGLKTHRKLVHKEGKVQEKKFVCESCDYRTYGRIQLELHQKSVHSLEQKFQCDASGCQFKTNYSATLRDHKLIHETDPDRRFPFLCTFSGCDFRRRLRIKLKKHTHNHSSSTQQLQCPSCPKKYPDKISLNFHRDLIHKNICFRCTNCNYSARSKRNLGYHVRNQCWARVSCQQQRVTVVKTSTSKLPVRETRNENIGFNFQGNFLLLPHAVNLYGVPALVLEKIHIKVL